MECELCLLLHQWGLVVGWACATANVADNTFQWLIRQFEGRMILLSDTAFQAADGDPANLTLCQRGAWEDRRLPLHESHAPALGVFSRPARVHDGRLQCARPVVWLLAQCGWLRAPLDGGVQFVSD